MNEVERALRADQLIIKIATEIEDFKLRNGEDKESEHLEQAQGVVSADVIQGLWSEARIAKETSEADDFDPDWPEWFRLRKAKERAEKKRPKVIEKAEAALKADALEESKIAKPLTVEEVFKQGELTIPNTGTRTLTAPLIAGNVDCNKFLAAMNERHAVIGNVGGKCRVLELVPSDLDPGCLIASYQTKTDLINRYANHQVGWTRRGDPLTVGQWWFEHRDRADYRGVVFKPGAPAVITRDEGGNWFNLWRGWGVPIERGRWPLMREHVEQVLSAGDPIAAKYNLWWTAWGFQNPADLPESALTFRGGKGGGKGIFLSTIRQIYGPHGLRIDQPYLLTGQFNAHLATCAYLFVDEGFWAGDKQGEAVLKGLITERPTMFTLKGVDSRSGVNHAKVSIAGNDDWLVPASFDERRFAVTDIDPKYAKNKAAEEDRKRYFGAIQQEIRDGGASAMLYDLLQIDLGDWHPREVPNTVGLMRQKKASLRGNWQWLEPLLQSGELPANAGQANRIRTEDLISYVQTFRGLEYATDESIAGFLYRDLGLSPELSPQGNKYRARDDSGKLRRGWEFPPLPELRSKWERIYGGMWDWHEPDLTCWQKLYEKPVLPKLSTTAFLSRKP